MNTSPIAINYNTPTGIVVVIFAISQSVAAVLERADDVTGSAGPFSVVSTIESTDLAGTPFVDLLPDDGRQRYYRAKHVHEGYVDSNYTDAVNARPAIIPEGLDLGSRPWLYNSSIPLQLVMDVVAGSETSSSLRVTASINTDPAGLGTPTVNYLSYSNTSVPINVGFNQWLLQKPASGQGRVVFQSTLSGRQPGLDAIDIQAADTTSTSSFLSLIMTQVSSSATSVTVSSSVVNPLAYPINVSLYSAQGVSPIAAGTGIWTITRPTASFGTAVFHVTSSTGGVIDDFDTVDVDYQNLTPLSVIGSVTSINSASLVAVFDVRDPYTTSGSLSGITFTLTSQSLSSFTASLGTLTNANGIYSQVVNIHRPDYGTGTGLVTATATKPGYTPDADSISVPEIVSGLAHLVVKADVTALSANTVTVSASAYDPISGSAAPTIGVSVQPAGAVSFTGTNPWTINRPLSGSVQFQVSASKAGRVEDIAYVAIASNPAAVTVTDFMELVTTQTSANASQVIMSASVINANGHPFTIDLYASNNDGGISGTNPYTITRPATGLASYTFRVTSTDPGIIPDSKDFFVDSTNQSILSILAKPSSVTATTITVDVTVYDPMNASSTLSGITLTATNSGNAGLTATLNSTTPNTGNTVYNYTITRPNPGTGSGRVTFTSTKTGYTPAADSVDVSEAALTFLACTCTAISSSTQYFTVAVTGSDYINDGTAPTIALENPSGIGNSRTSTANSASTCYEVWSLTRPAIGTSPAGVVFDATKTNRITATAPFLVTNMDATGSGGGGDTTVAAFYQSTFDTSADTITLAWMVNNPPAGGSYDLVYHQTLSDGTSDDSGTATNVTSPYDFNTLTLGTIDLVTKGSAGWAFSSHDFQLRVKTGGGTVVATADISVSHYGVQVV